MAQSYLFIEKEVKEQMSKNEVLRYFIKSVTDEIRAAAELKDEDHFVKVFEIQDYEVPGWKEIVAEVFVNDKFKRLLRIWDKVSEREERKISEIKAARPEDAAAIDTIDDRFSISFGEWPRGLICDSRILVKISGDLSNNDEVLEEINDLAEINRVWFISGFGTDYSKALDTAGISYRFKKGIRCIKKSQEQRGLTIGLRLQEKRKKRLVERLPAVEDFIDCITADEKGLRNTNADDLILKYGPEFDKVLIYTIKGRDKSRLAKLRNVNVKYI